MADKKNVSEGSVESFIKNFRDLYNAFQKNYGLTKEESQALNDERLRQASTNAATVAGAGAGAMLPGGPLWALLGGALSGGASTRLNGDLLNRISKSPSQLRDLKEMEEPDDDVIPQLIYHPSDEPGVDLTLKSNNALNRALRKTKGGIPAAGTFNEYLNSDFLTNLRRNRK